MFVVEEKAGKLFGFYHAEPLGGKPDAGVAINDYYGSDYYVDDARGQH